MSRFLGLVMASCLVDQNVLVLLILSEDFFLEITMILRQKLGNLRLISSENFFFFFFIENTDNFFSFNKCPGLPLCKYGKPNYYYI